jgi:hypothetical protein
MELLRGFGWEPVEGDEFTADVDRDARGDRDVAGMFSASTPTGGAKEGAAAVPGDPDVD